MTLLSVPALEARGLRLAYDERVVLDDLSLTVAPGTVTALLGGNGCGKSTLLKALGRLVTPARGEVLLHGRPLRGQAPRQVARQLAFLPQKPLTPSATRVRDLVSRGRHPHQGLLRPRSGEDHRAVEAALAATGLLEVADQDAGTLSGGQLQRAWVALVLAQDAGTLLLDEPTTYLDLAHQLEVLRLIRRVNAERGTTVVMVLHDLSLAARFADRLVVLAGGGVLADGDPWEVLTPATLARAFGLDAAVMPDPHTGTPWVVPREPGAGCAGRSASAMRPLSLSTD